MVSTSTDLATISPDGNLQFHNLTIQAGGSLFVSSGAVIRCSGSFTNQGTITVDVSAVGGYSYQNGAPTAVTSPPAQGLGAGIPTGGQQGPNTILLNEGYGGMGLSNAFQASFVRSPGLFGGGGGGVSAPRLGLFAQGGSGGGTLVVLARGALTLASGSSLLADGNSGFNGAGGGGGGVVILASPTSLLALGTIEAKGGPGGASTAEVAAGGGGGGGIIHFLSPSITLGVSTLFVVGGGAPGARLVAVTDSPRSSGAGGGSCAGIGGNGSSLGPTPTNTQGTPSSGTSGFVISTQVDPTDTF